MITNETILSNTMRNRINELEKELEVLQKLYDETDEFLPDVSILIDNLSQELKYLRKQVRRF